MDEKKNLPDTGVAELQEAVLALRARVDDLELLSVLRHYYELGPSVERGDILRWLSEGKTVRLVPHRDPMMPAGLRITAEVQES